MKKLLIALSIVFVVMGSAWADEEKPVKARCPITTMQTDCLKCHVIGDFRVIETKADAHLIYPTKSMQIIDGEGYFLLTNINDVDIKDYFDYLHRHGIKKAVIEIHSPGGALFDAQRIVGIIRYWQARGVIVETHLMGSAFSAGFYIFTAGDKRLVDEYSDLMWHEIQISSWGFNVTTPSDSEEKVRIYRHIQDIRNNYLATRSKLTLKEINEMVARKELWISGKQAVEYGFADGFFK